MDTEPKQEGDMEMGMNFSLAEVHRHTGATATKLSSLQSNMFSFWEGMAAEKYREFFSASLSMEELQGKVSELECEVKRISEMLAAKKLAGPTV